MTESADERGKNSSSPDDEGVETTPWHFKLLLLVLILYLGYRLIQLIVWLSGKF